jgi:hypothetical protein
MQIYQMSMYSIEKQSTIDIWFVYLGNVDNTYRKNTVSHVILYNELHRFVQSTPKQDSVKVSPKVTCLPYYMVKEGIETGQIGELSNRKIKKMLQKVDKIPSIAQTLCSKFK